MKRLTTEEIKLLSPEAAEWIFNEAEKKHNLPPKKLPFHKVPVKK